MPTSELTSLTSLDFAVIFSESVTNVGSADFVLSTDAGAGAGTITVSTVNASSYVVTVAVDTAGIINLDIASNHDITDTAGNPLATATAPDPDESFTVDTTQFTPLISANVTSPTNQQSITFTVDFTEEINASTFTISDISASYGTISAPTTIDNQTFEFTITGLTAGTLTVSIPADSVDDLAQNKNLISDTLTITIDTTAPSLTSVTRSSPASELTSLTSLDFAVTFSESVTGVDASDFAVSGTGTGSVSDISGSGSSYTVTVDVTSNSGTIGLSLVATNHDIIDSAGTALTDTSSDPDETYTIDAISPSLTSITRNSPATETTSETNLNFTATFSEPVTNVGPTDFVLSTDAGTGTITVSPVSASSYVVSVEVTADGIINLDIASGHGITDTAGNPLATATAPDPDESFTVDTTQFIPLISFNTTSPTNQQSITFTVDFTEEIDPDTFIASDISTSDGTTSAPTTNDNQTFEFTITGLTAGTLTVSIPADSVDDLAQNKNLVSETLTITIDTTAPSLTSITRSSPTSELTSLTSLEFAVIFSESVTNVGPTDFVLSTDAGAGTGDITVSTVNASSYVVTVAVTTTGIINLDVASGYGITDTAGNPLATATAPDPDESFTVDTTQFTPSISANVTSPTNQQSITFTVDFTEEINASTFTISDISASYGTISAPTTIDNQTFEFTITGLTAGLLTVSIPADSVDDLAQNKNLVSETLTIIIDTTAPSLTSITRSSPTTELTSNTSLDFAVTFSESVTGVDASDFAVSGTGTGSVSDISGSGSSYTVTVDVTSNSGTIGLSLVATNHDIIDSAGTALTDTSSDPDETYTIDAISPSLTSITRNSPATETTSETSLNFTATFSEPVTNVGPTDFVLSTGAGTGTITVSPVDTSSYVVSVEVTTDGIINLDVASGHGITDTAGNPLTTATAPNPDESFTVDTTQFTPLISANVTSPTNQQSITFTVDFTEEIDPDTFIESDISASDGTVSTPTTNDNQTFEFTITGLTAGTLTVSIPADSVDDLAQNKNLVSDTLTITIDTTAPSLSSITRSSPTSELTSLTSLEFAVIFSESVTNVGSADFVLSTDAGAGTGDITVSTVNASSYVVTVAVDTAGIINLDVASNHDITDTAGNPLATATAPDPDESFTVDTTQFTPSINANVTSPTNQQSITFTVDFTEEINASTFTISDISASYGTVSAPTTNDNQTFEFTITGLTAGLLTVSIPADSVDDLAQNKNLVSETLTITIDTTAPSLTSVTRSSPASELTSLTSLDFAVTFSESVTGVDASDFAVSGTGTGSVSDISGSGSSYTVTVDVTSNSGTIGLSLVATNHDIIDSAGTALTDTSSDPDETYTIDAISPSLTSITRNSPATETTSETNLNFTATFSEPVTNVGPTDFVLSTDAGAGTGTITVSPVDTSSYVVSVEVTTDGIINLDVASGHGITDTAGNPLATATAPNPDESFTVDTTQFTPLISSNTTSPTNQQSITFTVDFTEEIDPDTFIASDISASDGTTSAPTTNDNQTFEFTITGLTAGTLTVSIPADSVDDLAQNKNLVSDTLTITIDTTAPSLTSITRSSPTSELTSLTSLEFAVIFSESVTNVGSADFVLSTDAGAGTGDITVSTVNASSYVVTVAVDTAGIINLDVASNHDITDTAGNPLATATAPDPDESFTVDTTQFTPLISANVTSPTNQQSITFTVDFGEPIDPTTFIESDISASDGTISAPTTIDNQTFEFTITGLTAGTLTVSIPADSVDDLAQNKNLVSETLTIIIDTTPPSLSSITRSTPTSELTSLTSLDFAITFSESVTGVDTSDFAISGTGTGSVSDISGSGSIYIITVDVTSNSGTIGLDLVATNHDIIDSAGTALTDTSSDPDETYTIDAISPSLTSITRNSPATETTSETSLNFTATFSEPVTNVGPTDFVLSTDAGAGAGTITVSPVDTSSYVVSVEVTTDGIINLDVASGHGITDTAGNPLTTATAPNPDESFTVDTTQFTPLISANVTSPTNQQSITFTVDFTEEIDPDTFIESDISASDGTVSTPTTNDNQTFEFTITGLTAGTLTVSIPADSVDDLAQNKNLVSDTLTITIDTTAPSLSSITRSSPTSELTSLTSLEFAVIFSESVTNVGSADFVLSTDAGAGTGDITVSTVNASSYVVTVAVDTAGIINLDVASNHDITDTAGNPLATATAPDPDESFTVDTTQFTPLISFNTTSPTNQQSITFTVDFGEPIDPTTFIESDISASDGTVSEPTTDNNQTFEFTITGLTAGTLTVSIPADSVDDLAQNKNLVSETLTIIIDTTAPSLTSITRSSPTSELTSLTSLDFAVTFSESVTNVGSADFVLSTDAGAGTITVSTVNASSYVVTVAVDTAGIINLDVASNHDITDTAGNPLATATAPNPDESFTVDTTQFTPLISFNTTSPTNQQSITFAVDFGEPIDPTTFIASDISASYGTVSEPTTVNNQTFEFTITGLTAGTLTVSIPADSVDDLAQNKNLVSETLTITIDTTAPSLTSITRSTPTSELTSLTSLDFAITFSESVTGVDTSDFAISGTGTGSVSDISGSGSIYIITVDVTSNSGTIGLDLVATNHDIIDSAGTALTDTSSDPDETYTIDAISPSLTSITRNSPATETTSETSLNFTATFSEPVTNVGPTDFVLSTDAGAGTGTITVSPVSASSYVVSVTVTTTGIINLDVASNHDITDTAGNDLTDTAPNPDESFTVDTAQFTLSVNTNTPSPTNQQSITFKVDFDEPIDPATFTASDVSASKGTVSEPTTDNNQTFEFTITGLTTGTLTVFIPADSVDDLAQNKNLVSNTVTITIDTTPPSLSSITRSSPASELTSLTSLDFAVTFSESVTNVGSADFVLSTDAGAGTGTITVSTINASSYVVTVADATAGTINLDVASNHDITDTAGNPLTTATAPNPDESFTVDTTQFTPSINANVTSPTNQQSITFTVDFGEPIDPDTFTTSDISASSGTVSEPTTDDNQTFEFTITGLGAGTLTVFIPADSVHDLAENNNLISNTVTIEVGSTSLYVTSITRSSPAIETTSDATPVFLVEFNTDVQNVDQNDFELSPDSPTDGYSQTFKYTSTPSLDIVPHNTDKTDTITVTASGTVSDVSVTVDITHTWRGDLLVQLVSPDNQIVTLHNRVGGSADDITETYTLEYGDDVSINGDWQLRMNDNYPLDSGILNSWTLTLGDGTTAINPISSVTGSGSQYYVTIMAITSGIYNLDIAQDTDIVNSANIPLTSLVPANQDHSYNVTITVDNVKPVITLTDSTVDTTLGTPYVDAGATCIDDTDGDISQSHIQVDNPVNTDIAGTYTVTFTCDDSAGNPAVPVTRTVNVIDTPPTVTSITRSSPATPSTNSNTLEFAVLFNEAVTGVSTDDFELSPDSPVYNTTQAFVYTSTPSLDIVPHDTDKTDTITVSESGTVSDVSVTVDITHTWRGDLLVQLVSPDNQIVTLHNRVGGSADDITETYTLEYGDDVSINGDWQLRMNDNYYLDSGILNSWTLTLGDGASSGPITSVTGSGSQYLVTVSAPEAGTYNLDVSSDNNIVDSASNSLSSLTPTTGDDQSYTVTSSIDRTPPTIQLVGQSPADTVLGTPYVDAGATCTDAVDGDITSQIQISNLVNTDIAGTYTVTFTCDDSAGNPAVPVTRTVNVIDTPPTVTSITRSSPATPSTNSNTLEFAVLFNEAVTGVSTDDFELSPDSPVYNTTQAFVYTSTPSLDIVPHDTDKTDTITVSESGTVSDVSVTVDITHTWRGDLLVQLVSPDNQIVTLHNRVGGSADDITETYTLEYGDDVSINGDWQLRMNDNYYLDSGILNSWTLTLGDGASSGPITSVTGSGSQYLVTVSAPEAGTYNLDVSSDNNIVDSASNSLSSLTPTTGDDQSYTVTSSIDRTPPTIQLVGQSPADTVLGTPYVDAGATCTDAVDGDITSQIQISNLVNTDIAGTYTVTFTCDDSAGNPAVPVTRTVNVIDTPPTVTSITRSSPATPSTNSNTLEFAVLFNEAVTGVSTDDFELSPDSPVYNTTQAFVYTSTPSLDIVPHDTDKTDTITVTASGTVSDVSVTVDITHTWRGDLLVQLVSPDNQIVTLHNRVGGSADDITETYTLEYGDDVSINGDWQLRMNDNYYLDSGILNSWTLTLGDGASSGPITSVTGSGSQYLVTVSAPEAGTYNLDVSSDNNIVDSASNSLSSLTPTTGDDQSYTVTSSIDRTPPTIQLVGQSPADTVLGTPYVDAGATCTDAVDGDITSQIQISNLVNTDIAGTYTVTFTCDDSAGNPAVPVTRTVNVIDTPPTVTSITRSSPATPSTNSNTLEFAVLFNEAVTGVSTDDFELSPDSPVYNTTQAFVYTSTPSLDIVPHDTDKTDTITVTASGTVSDVSVTVDITHTWRGDLLVQLVSPDNQIVTLHNRVGGSADDITETYTLEYGDDVSINGDWQLRMNDNYYLDSGILNSWTLTLGDGASSGPITSVTGSGSQYLVTVSAPEAGTYNLDVSSDNNIVDSASNSLSSLTPTTGDDQSYTVTAITP